MRKPSPAIRGAETTLGILPGLYFLLAAQFLFNHLALAPLLIMRGGRAWVLGNASANGLMLGLVAVAWLVWIFARARQWVTAATGAGFVIAATGIIVRIVAEMPHLMAQMPLEQLPPPEPYGSSLALARGLGLVAFAFGLACVLAACLAERRLRRSGPTWTLPD